MTNFAAWVAASILTVAVVIAKENPEDDRLALGSRLIEFEQRLAAHPPEESAMRTIDSSFDRLSLAFFAGQSDTAMAQLDELIAKLPPARETAPPAKAEEPAPVAPDRLREERDAFTSKLELLRTSALREGDAGHALLPAIQLALTRAAKLRDDLHGDTFRLVEPLVDLRSALKGEVSALARGVNPYDSRVGMIWRAFDSSGEWKPGSNSIVPYRLFTPESLTDARGERTALPLVIAFHGMGGDENMFGFAYGAGRLVTLAKERGFIAITPLTYSFSGKRGLERLNALIDDVARDYRIDRSRIYLVGHSLGAGTALSLAALDRAKIAAVVAFSGGGIGAAPLPPALLFSGEQDSIVPFASVKRGAERAGKDIEFVPVPGRGHTLLVGEHLDRAIDFLLAHRLDSK